MPPSFPATLNLNDHAKIAIKGMLNSLDEQSGFLPFFYFQLAHKPPFASHSEWDCQTVARYIHSLVVTRHMSGSAYGMELEAKLLESFYSMLSEQDGLGYRWESSSTNRMADMHDQREFLMGLGTRATLLGDQEASHRFRKLCAGLKRIALGRRHSKRLNDSFLFFPNREYYADSGWPIGQTSPAGASSAATDGGMIYPLVCYFEATGDELALDLAEKFTRHVMYHSSAFHPDGSFAHGTEMWSGHFHSCSRTLTGIAKLGLVLGNVGYLEWAKRSYQWAKSVGSSFGWFPERVSSIDCCETCCITDMIKVAIFLALAGYEEYWNDAEKFIRNQLIEQHLTNVDWIEEDIGNTSASERIIEEIGPVISIRGRKPPLNYITTEGIRRRSYGAFAGWAAVNDFVGWNTVIQSCCTAAGADGLYAGWKNAITSKFHRTFINFLLNRETRDVRVISYLPLRGRIQIWPKKDINVLLRIPQWVQRREIHCVCDGTPRELSWRGSFLDLGSLIPDQVVNVDFPVHQGQTVERVGNREYTLEWRGDTVVSITPPGKIHPLYNRESMKASIPDDPVPGSV